MKAPPFPRRPETRQKLLRQISAFCNILLQPCSTLIRSLSSEDSHQHSGKEGTSNSERTFLCSARSSWPKASQYLGLRIHLLSELYEQGADDSVALSTLQDIPGLSLLRSRRLSMCRYAPAIQVLLWHAAHSTVWPQPFGTPPALPAPLQPAHRGGRCRHAMSRNTSPHKDPSPATAREETVRNRSVVAEVES